MKKLTYAIQCVTFRYRVRKSKQIIEQKLVSIEDSTLFVVVIFFSLVIVRVFENDEQSQFIMITTWIHAIKLRKTLLDDESLMKLLNKRLLRWMNSSSKIYINEYLRVSLTTNKIDVLTNYVMLLVNVEEIQTLIKIWLIDVEIYDLLLDLI